MKTEHEKDLENIIGYYKHLRINMEGLGEAKKYATEHVIRQIVSIENNFKKELERISKRHCKINIK